jgi:D-hydroxyproline dehydrogenase subunit gamma|tara:strand:+ start:70272 stop:70535 length:264 start_codon:yes stop_codon:yes gene_type:complete
MIERSEEISFKFDGKSYRGYAGESVGAALLRAGITHLRNAPNTNTPRGMFCVMGACQECVVVIDGRKVEACRAELSDGLNIKRAVNV